MRSGRPAPRGRSIDRYVDGRAVPIALDLAGAGACRPDADPRDRMIAIVGHDLRGLLHAAARSTDTSTAAPCRSPSTSPARERADRTPIRGIG